MTVGGPSPAAALDRAAFGDLIERYDRRLRGLAYQLLGGDAQGMDDVLQEAYLKAYLALPNFRGDADPGTWLYRIVYNATIDELRRRARRPEPVDVEARRRDRPSTENGPDVRADDADAVLRALRALPDGQRVTLVLVDGQGFDTATVAGILGVAPGTVRSRLTRARAKAREIIGEAK